MDSQLQPCRHGSSGPVLSTKHFILRHIYVAATAATAASGALPSIKQLHTHNTYAFSSHHCDIHYSCIIA